MKAPLFVRPLTDDERQALEDGLRSSDAFVLRRCQLVLASSRGERAPAIATHLGCASQSVRNVIRGFNDHGVAVLARQSSRPKTVHHAFGSERTAELQALLHQSPRAFGKDTSVWTLNLAADVSVEQGITSARVSDETIRNVLMRHGVCWKRAKRWITSPDPAYDRKKASATG